MSNYKLKCSIYYVCQLLTPQITRCEAGLKLGYLDMLSMIKNTTSLPFQTSFLEAIYNSDNKSRYRNNTLFYEAQHTRKNTDPKYLETKQRRNRVVF